MKSKVAITRRRKRNNIRNKTKKQVKKHLTNKIHHGSGG